MYLLHYRYFKEFNILTDQERKCLYLTGKGKTIKNTAREYREDSIKK